MLTNPEPISAIMAIASSMKGSVRVRFIRKVSARSTTPP